MSNHDPLTGLPNYFLFRDRLSQVLAQAHRTGQPVTVLFLNLDHFNIINNSLGHTSGDRVLNTVAQRLTGCVRQSDTVARVGGDEFAFVLTGHPHGYGAAIVAQKVLATLSQPFTLEGVEVCLTASIGIALFPSDGQDADTLAKQASTAMHHAKAEGNTYCFFSAEMGAKTFERLALESSLRKALERGEFLVFYQPQVALDSGQIIGMEALLRWQHPDAGMIGPAQFIPHAEETGLIVPIGEWVLRAACTQNKAWQAAGFPPLRIAVNLSARQFSHPDLLSRVQQVLQETGLDSRYLELELTESILMKDSPAGNEVLQKLNALGVRLSLDDFGTGYSSLCYLKRFPVHALKIDQSFVHGLGVDSGDAAVAKAIIVLAHSLNLKAIAEGVETEEQLTFLRAHRCDEMQGYYFSPPVPPKEATRLLQERRQLTPIRK